MEDIRHEVSLNKVKLHLITKNKGKFRWKNRENNSKYGEGFATRTTPFEEESYMEWQIGYDFDINHPKKTTILKEIEFIGSNKKRKNPYELSEILFLAKEAKLISNKNLEELIFEIKNRKFSFDEQYKIETNEKETVKISDFVFHRQDIVLPTFSYYESDRSLSIEISIQKQQYASGVQPMVYFTIPISCFDNSADLLGKTSREVDEATLSITPSNIHYILNLFRYFGICSWRHRHDVLSILELLAAQ